MDSVCSSSKGGLSFFWGRFLGQVCVFMSEFFFCGRVHVFLEECMFSCCLFFMYKLKSSEKSQNFKETGKKHNI